MSSLSNFIHQKTYEKTVHEVRRHPFIILPSLLLFFILLAVPAGLFFLIYNVFPGFLSRPTFYLISVLIASCYYLMVGLIYYTHFINYYLDLLVITNDRLMHIEQHGLFSRSISEVDLYRIQDVTSNVNGFFPSLFNFGSILVQTAGAAEKFMIHNVPKPEKLRHEILLLAEEDRKYHTSSVN